MPKLTKKAVNQIKTLIQNTDINGLERPSEKTTILITQLFDILTQGHTQDGDDWLYDSESGLIKTEVIWDLAGRWRFEMGLGDPWISVTNRLTSKLSRSQTFAVRNCELNSGVEPEDMRFDYCRVLGFTCRGCGVDTHSHVSSFILNRLSLCNKCQLNSLEGLGENVKTKSATL